MSLTLGQFIRERRREMGYTQEQFAALLGEGVRQSEISRLEQGQVDMPRPDRMQQIASVLDVPVGELLMLTGWARGDASDVDPSAGGPQQVEPEHPPRTVDEIVHDSESAVRHARDLLDSLDDARDEPPDRSN